MGSDQKKVTIEATHAQLFGLAIVLKDAALMYAKTPIKDDTGLVICRGFAEILSPLMSVIEDEHHRELAMECIVQTMSTDPKFRAFVKNRISEN